MRIGELTNDCIEMSQGKTRDLPLYEYFNKLQEEYISAELRKKIYPKLKDKKYWDKVMGFKKKKIEDITLRNCLHSIFNNEKIKEKQYLKVYPKFGFPVFVYKDKEDEELTLPLDKQYYYNIGSSFKAYVNENEILIGELVQVSKDYSLIYLKIDEGVQTFNSTLVSRIL